MSDFDFDYEPVLEKVSGFRYSVQKERELRSKVKMAINTLGAAAVNICSVISQHYGPKPEEKETTPPLISADLTNEAVYIRAHRRRLTFAILHGVGDDRRLPNARNERCGQILAFVHIFDQDSAHIVSRLNIYSNGEVTDGENTWNLNKGLEASLPYLADVMSQYLFDMDLAWAPTDELPPYLLNVPIVKGELHLESLRRTNVEINLDGAKVPLPEL